MGTTIRRLFVFALVFFHLLPARGQSNTDVQYRLITALDYKPSKKWKVAAEYRYSADQDLQQFRNSYFQFEGKYALNKRLSLSGGYRFTTSFEQDAHRFFGALGYSQKLNKRFSLVLASKYQYTTNRFNREFMSEFREPVHMLREKLSLEFNVPKSKLLLHGGVEAFIRTRIQEPLAYNRTRYLLGASYGFGDYGKFGLTLFYDDRSNPESTDRLVLVTKYTLSLDKFLKRGKEESK